MDGSLETWFAAMNKLFTLCIFQLIATGICLRAEDWPQWRGPNRDGTWSEKGTVERFADRQIPIVWRAKIGPGYSGPTVSDGRVFVMYRVTKPQQQERVLCFDEKTGKPLWTHTYDCPYVGIGYTAGPRSSVTIEGNRAFALGAMGHLHCLDVASGKVQWQHDCHQEYSIEMPMWGIAGAPLVYKELVIVHIGGKDACVVAFDQANGKESWRALSERGQYTAPILVQQGGQDVIVVWTGDSVSGLQPETGKPYWRIPFAPRQMPIGVATPIVQEDRLFLTSFYDGSMMVQLEQDKPQAKVLWRRVGESEMKTEALHSIISTPLFLGDHIYGVDSYGELRCLRAKDGERVWENLTATPKSRWSTIHFVQQQDLTWMFNERGELIIARLSPEGFHEISRAKLIEPTTVQLDRRGGVCWAHPAFANGHVFARNDEELVCGSLLTTAQASK
jgi:outer membrane protein assembly factor BamB